MIRKYISIVKWIYYTSTPSICLVHLSLPLIIKTKIAKFMGPTWGSPGSCRPQMDPMLAPWTLLSEIEIYFVVSIIEVLSWLTGILIQCMMVLAAVSLMANIYVVCLHETSHTMRMSTTARYIILHMIGPILCHGSKQIPYTKEMENVAGKQRDGSPNKENHRHSNTLNRDYKNDDNTSSNENNRHSNDQQSFAGTYTGFNACVREERRAAADILDRLFLVLFCVAYIILGIYSFMID